LSILLVTTWIGEQVDPSQLPMTPQWHIYALGYLLATYVWFITERILAYADKPYQQELNAQMWPRMAARALLLTLLLLGSNWLVRGQAVGVLVAPLPYLFGPYRWRALLVDIAVAVLSALLILLASGV
jgi:hypothetical protein